MKKYLLCNTYKNEIIENRQYSLVELMAKMDNEQAIFAAKDIVTGIQPDTTITIQFYDLVENNLARLCTIDFNGDFFDKSMYESLYSKLNTTELDVMEDDNLQEFLSIYYSLLNYSKKVNNLNMTDDIYGHLMRISINDEDNYGDIVIDSKTKEEIINLLSICFIEVKKIDEDEYVVELSNENNKRKRRS